VRHTTGATWSEVVLGAMVRLVVNRVQSTQPGEAASTDCWNRWGVVRSKRVALTEKDETTTEEG
jgi:hypothetical protein